jgi:hypothetical protein
MSEVVVHRRNRKLAVFRELLEGLLGKDIVNTISCMVKQMTVRVQKNSIPEDHSIALSSRSEGNIHVVISRKDEYLWSGFLPAEDQGCIKYNTGHDLVIIITRNGPTGFYMRSHVSGDDESLYEGFSDIPPQHLKKGVRTMYSVDRFDLYFRTF